TDTKELMVASSTGIDNSFFKKEIEKGKNQKVSWDCSKSEHCELTNTAMTGHFYFKPKGQSYKANDIKEYITTFLLSNENRINAWIKQWNNNNPVNSNAVSAMDESTKKEFELYYKMLGYDEKDIENFLSGKTFKLFIEGYTALSSRDLKYPIFNKTLFLSDREFGRLKSDFEKLTVGQGTAEESKEAIEASYKSIIKAYKGGDITDKQFNNTKFSDLLYWITNLPVTNKLFDMKIHDIKIEKDEDKVRKIGTSFIGMYKRLQAIENDPYSIYEEKDRVFYWVKESTFHIDD
ncbi:MAG: hypothetical protein ABI855_16290, partial [Bacteroidota bacterium]